MSAPDDTIDVFEPTKLQLAVSALRSTPYWAEIILAIKERREMWIRDTRIANVYQAHSELVHVTARVAELDHWLDQLE